MRCNINNHVTSTLKLWCPALKVENSGGFSVSEILKNIIDCDYVISLQELSRNNIFKRINLGFRQQQRTCESSLFNQLLLRGTAKVFTLTDKLIPFHRLFFCYPHLRSTKSEHLSHASDTLTQKVRVCLYPQHSLNLQFFHSTAGTEVLGLWEWKSFLERFLKNKIRNQKKLEGGLHSALASVGSPAQIQQLCGLQPQKRRSPVWKCFPPTFSCFFWKEIQQKV